MALVIGGRCFAVAVDSSCPIEGRNASRSNSFFNQSERRTRGGGLKGIQHFGDESISIKWKPTKNNRIRRWKKARNEISGGWALITFRYHHDKSRLIFNLIKSSDEASFCEKALSRWSEKPMRQHDVVRVKWVALAPAAKLNISPIRSLFDSGRICRRNYVRKAWVGKLILHLSADDRR